MLKKTNEPTTQDGPLVTQVKTMSKAGSVEKNQITKIRDWRCDIVQVRNFNFNKNGFLVDKIPERGHCTKSPPSGLSVASKQRRLPRAVFFCDPTSVVFKCHHHKHPKYLVTARAVNLFQKV